MTARRLVACLAVASLAGIASALSHPVDGIAGASVLRRATVRVDVAKGSVGIGGPAAESARSGTS